MRAHEGDSYCLVTAPPAEEVRLVTGQPWRRVPLATYLAELEPRDPCWVPLILSRVLVMSRGPVLVAKEGPLSSRLEAARVPRVGDDQDWNQARDSFWPTLPALRELAIGAGSPAPELVLVGERDPFDRIPFLSRSGVWLFAALRKLGWDELRVYLTNALGGPDGGKARTSELARLRDAFAPYEPSWVALGRAARETLEAAGVEHSAVVHPAKHRRFSFKEGVDGYAAHLRAQGVPDGPYANGTMPAEAGSRVLPEQLGMPLTVAYKKTESTNQTDELHVAKAGGLRLDLVEKARRAFVLGEVGTVKDAAILVFGVEEAFQKDRIDKLSKYANAENWKKERAEYLVKLRERTKLEAGDAEARAIVETRRAAWGAAVLGVTNLLRQLRDGSIAMRPSDVKALVEAALTLSERSDPASDGERDRLKSLPLPDLAREFQETLKAQFGDDIVRLSTEK